MSDFTLVSWNIFQGLHHSSRRNTWILNLSIVDHLAALDADVLVLPEAWRFRREGVQWAEELADELGYELHQWVADSPTRHKDLVPWRLVILTRIAARRLEDHVMPPFGYFGQRAVVKVELMDSGLQLAGVHLHGVHLLTRRQPRAWLRERSELRAICTTNDIVAGDFNMWGPVVHRDARPLRPVVEGRTFPAKRPHSQIDHLLVSDRVEVVSSEVLPDLGSDHLGIKAVLRPRKDSVSAPLG